MIKSLDLKIVSQLGTSVALQNLSSFVKELIENSIDAESSQINLTFFDFGNNGFEINDNGMGIKCSDWDKIATQGGTSKLLSWEELQEVDTLGFRGEALNAISKLSRLIITSKHNSDEVGWTHSYSEASLIKPQNIAKEKGTTITVTDLFYTLPVRKIDYQKNYKGQYNKTINLITEYAIIYPEIEFKIWNQEPQMLKKQLFHSGTTCTLGERIQSILGEQVFGTLIPINITIDTNYGVEGYVSKDIDSGSIGHIKRNCFYCYVNRRPINTPKQILNLMTGIYRQYNPNGKIIYILNLKFNNNKDVDFNVSVDKRDVYLNNIETIITALEQELMQLFSVQNQIGKSMEASQKSQKPEKRKETKANIVQETIREPEKVIKSENEFSSQNKSKSKNFLNLFKSQMTQKQQSQPDHSIFSRLTLSQPVKQEQEQIPLQSIANTTTSQIEQVQPQLIEEESINQPSQIRPEIDQKQTTPMNDIFMYDEKEQIIPFQKKCFKDLKILGQFNKGFIVSIFENGRQIFILDQHACDEKKNFERLQAECILTPTITLKPFEINLQGYEIEIARYHEKQLKELGYSFDVKDNKFLLNRIPAYKKNIFSADMFPIVLQNLSNQQDKSIVNLMPGLKQLLANKACRTSIMVGQVLEKMEMKTLCQAMGDLQSPWNCPHGRPTFIRINTSLSILIAKVKIARGFSK